MNIKIKEVKSPLASVFPCSKFQKLYFNLSSI